MTISWREYEKALLALKEALTEPKTSITRDASIQRFEFCVELAWKTSKKFMDTDETIPKSIIREMGKAKLIDSVEDWFSYLKARNLSSHTYNEILADQVYSVAQKFLPDGFALLKKLQTL